MWLDSVVNAISEVETIHPGSVERVASFDPNVDWSESQWKDYRDVTGAIVEPFNFPGGSSDDEDFFYEKVENGDLGFIKSNLPGIPNREAWIKVIDLVEFMGY